MARAIPEPPDLLGLPATLHEQAQPQQAQAQQAQAQQAQAQQAQAQQAQAPGSGSAGSGSGSAEAGSAGPGLAGRGLAGSALSGLSGSVNLTMPLASFLGAAAPGDVAGFGPVDAGTCRTMAAALAASQRTSRWCLTLTDSAGRAVGHGCVRRGPAASAAGGWEFTITITDLGPECSHRGITRVPAVAEPPHLVETRQRTCSFPGCRRAAKRCDLDHTIPHDQGGRTCACNLTPLRRRHHRGETG